MTRPADIPQEWSEPVAWVVQLKYGPDQWSGEMLTDHLPADDTTYRMVRPLYDARALLAAYERGRGEQREVDADGFTALFFMRQIRNSPSKAYGPLARHLKDAVRYSIRGAKP